MKRMLILASLVGLAFCLAIAPAQADLVVGNVGAYGSYAVPATFPTVGVAVNFTHYNYNGIFTGGPETIFSNPSMTINLYSSNDSGLPPFNGYPAGDAYLGGGYFGFEGGALIVPPAIDNGNWGNIGANDPMRLSGLNYDTGYMKYMFSTPVAAVGGFMNYDPYIAQTYPVHVIALDINGNPISGANYIIADNSTNLIQTPGMHDYGAFVGITMNSNSIYGLELQNGFVALTDLRYNAVPLPASLWLLGSGLLGLLGLRKKIKA